MRLAHLTWPEVGALDRDTVVVVPTGAVEQHGPHLPLVTDTRIATAIGEAVDARVGEGMVLTPTVWLGASGHHLGFAGTLSAGFGSYHGALLDVIGSLSRHGFHRFAVLNGHGGNADPNRVALRDLKLREPHLTLAAVTYPEFWEQELLDATLTGGIKGIQHSCEAEVSLMLHLAPELVRVDRLRDDGLRPEGGVLGLVAGFDEITEQGSFGFATLATAEKGRVLFEAAVAGAERWVRQLREGVAYVGIGEL